MRSVNGRIRAELVSDQYAGTAHHHLTDLVDRHVCGAADIIKDVPGTSFLVQNDDTMNRPCPSGMLDESAIHTGSFQSLPRYAGKFIIPEYGPVRAMGAQTAGCGKGRGYLPPHMAPLAIYLDLLIRRRVRIYVQGIVYGNGSEAKNIEL